MKYLTACLTLSTATLMATSAYAGDWTAELSAIKNGCDYYEVVNLDTLAKKYRASVISNKKSIDSKNSNTYGDNHIQTLVLKDVTAFGSPLSKIVWEETDGGEVGNFNRLTLHFADTNFMNNRSSFYIKVGNQTYNVGKGRKFSRQANDSQQSLTINDTGYEFEEDGRVFALNFDKKNKILNCGMYSY